MAKLTHSGELDGEARAGLTFLQSLQNTEELPRNPSTSPQSRHWESPLPIAFFCIVSSRSTSRLQHRTQCQGKVRPVCNMRTAWAQLLWDSKHSCSPHLALLLANSQSLVNLVLAEQLGYAGHWEYCNKQAGYTHGPGSLRI